MTVYWWYILKVGICIIVFYTFYILVLHNFTFFLLNRLYLVLGLLFSFIIPVLNLSIFQNLSDSALAHIIYPLLTEPEYESFQPQNLSEHVTHINYSIVLSIIYFTGITILFFKLLFSIIKIIRMINSPGTHQIGRTKIYQTDSNISFSFFNRIFLSKGENNHLIIEHEMAHVKQFHWFDLILIEIVSVLFWFNPFVVLYKKSLKLQHEYLADTSAIKDRNQIEEYLHCMLRQVQVASIDGIISQFYCKTIKKRIIMITKNKTSNKFLGVYSLALPLIFILLTAFSDHNMISIKEPEIVQDEFTHPSIYPIDSKKIKSSAGYGERINPKTKKRHFHYGIDFAIPQGEEVVSTADGLVVDAKFDTKKGNYVIISHNETYSTLYSHLKSISVQVGDNLKIGQILGYSGNTGKSTGPHLHYEVFKNGKNVNPRDFLPE